MTVDRRKAVIVAGGSVLATAVLVAVVFSLGSWAYQTRRLLSHERRLANLLEQHPTAADVTNALLAEPGTRLLDSPRSEGDLVALASPGLRTSRDEVLAKRRAASEVRVFAVGDMLYVLFFGADGRLQSYVLASS